jgi:hypothetical protein
MGRSILHLVRGKALPRELRDVALQDRVVFIEAAATGDPSGCRLTVCRPDMRERNGIGYEDLLDLIFDSDSVVTW